MNTKIKGYIFGIISAVSYAMNPLCALSLYEEGHNVNTVLVHRFILALLILGGIMLAQRKSFALTRREAGWLLMLGVVFAVSSITFFESFRYLGGGISATIVFMNPVIVALIMTLFFHERLTLSTALAVVLTVSGVLLLYEGEDGTRLSTVGVLYAMTSALAYALYIVMINRSRLIMSSVKLSFYAIIPCLTVILLWSQLSGETIVVLDSGREWFYATLLALVPTVVALVFMTMSINAVGSTPAAVMGALEPVTAVVIGYFMFAEPLTPRITLGVLVILSAVIIIIFGSRIGQSVKKVTRMKGLFRKYV